MTLITRLRRFIAAAFVFATASTPAEPPIPVGTTISIRTIDAVSSKQAEAGQSYRCSVDAPILVAEKELAPKGADCVLRIVETKSAGKLSGSNQLTLVLSDVRLDGRLVQIHTTPTEITGKGKGKSTQLRTGVGAGAGALVGGLFGGRRGAAIGAGTGAGAGAASAALTHGPEIKVAPETVLSFKVEYKAIRRAVPAGSVYFFDVIAGDAAALSSQWLQPVGETPDKHNGFGLPLFGIWNPHR